MTPNAYAHKVRDLFEAGQHREALAFADAEADAVVPALSISEKMRLWDTLHITATIVDAEDHDAALARQPAPTSRAV